MSQSMSTDVSIHSDMIEIFIQPEPLNQPELTPCHHEQAAYLPCVDTIAITVGE